MRTSVLHRLAISAGAAVCATALAACGAGNSGGQDTPPANPPTTSPSSSGQAPSSGHPTPGQTKQISRDQAGTIVTDRYGGHVLNVEADTADGEPSWEVEVANSEQGRIEVNVSRSSGDIVDLEHD